MNMNPRTLHMLMEIGSIATTATAILGIAEKFPLPPPWNLVVSGAGVVATGLLSWQKAAIVSANTPPAL